MGSCGGAGVGAVLAVARRCLRGTGCAIGVSRRRRAWVGEAVVWGGARGGLCKRPFGSAAVGGVRVGVAGGVGLFWWQFGGPPPRQAVGL